MKYLGLFLFFGLGLLILPIGNANTQNNEILPEVSLTITTDLSPGDKIGQVHVTVTSNMASTVTVYLGGTLYAELDLADLEDSFILDTLSVPNGGYTVLFDGVAEGFTASLKVSINIVNDYDPPIIITNITESMVYTGVILIEMSCDENAQMNLLVDDLSIYSGYYSGTPILVSVVTSEYADGDHIFSIYAEDDYENNYTVYYDIVFDNSQSIVPIIYTNLFEGIVCSGLFDVSFSSSEYVEFSLFLDEVLIYSKVYTGTIFLATVDTTTYIEGNHTFTIDAVDSDENTNSSSYIVFFKNDFTTPVLLSHNTTYGETYQLVVIFEFIFDELAYGSFEINNNVVGVFNNQTLVYLTFNCTASPETGFQNLTLNFHDFSGNYGQEIFLFYISTETNTVVSDTALSVLLQNSSPVGGPSTDEGLRTEEASGFPLVIAFVSVICLTIAKLRSPKKKF